jgi:DNA-binding transcriptional LysR family regulator
MGQDHRYKYKDIQLPQLRSFCLAATEGNFTAAATALGLSVPAVWQQVRALERELGVTLLRRRGRAVEATAPGRLLLELARPHVSGLDSLARLVQQFVRAHPSAQLNLRAGRWHEVLELVERGEADLGLAPWDREAPHRPALEYEALFEQPFMLLTADDHPLRRKKLLRPRDLVEHPFIVEPKDTCDYRALVRLLRRDDVTPEQLRVVMVSHTVDMTFRYVACGVGIALSHVDPSTCRSMAGVHGRVFDPKLERLPFALVVRKNSHRSGLAEEFRRAVRGAWSGKP